MLVGFCLWVSLTCWLVITIYSVGKENTQLVKENEELNGALRELTIEPPEPETYIPLEFLENFKAILEEYMLLEKQNPKQVEPLIREFELDRMVVVRFFDRQVDFVKLNRTFGNLNYIQYKVVDYSSEKGETYSIKFLYKNSI
jgi:hypothetical protein